MASISGDIDLVHPRRPVPRAYPRSRGPQGERRQEPADQPGSTWRWPRPASPTGGGTRPFGYRSDRLTVEPTEAAAIREAAARIRAGDSLRGLASDWNARGLRTVTGRDWSAQVLRRMLTSRPRVGPALAPRRDRRRRRVGADPDRRRHRPAPGDPRQPRPPDPADRPPLPPVGRPPQVRPVRRDPRRPAAGRGRPPLRLRQGTVSARLRPDRHHGRAARAARHRGRARTGSTRQSSPPPSVAPRPRMPRPTPLRPAWRPTRPSSTELATAYGEQQITFPEYLAARKPIEARIEAGQRKVGRLTRTTAIAELRRQQRRPADHLGDPDAQPSALDRRRPARPLGHRLRGPGPDDLRRSTGSTPVWRF